MSESVKPMPIWHFVKKNWKSDGEITKYSAASLNSKKGKKKTLYKERNGYISETPHDWPNVGEANKVHILE